MVVILGAGLAGLSSSYHLKHNCTVYEKNGHSGGHIYSHQINGFTWDEGPHVSFTKHEYVKNLFSESLDGEFHEFPAYPTNYYKGHWVPHPAQANLYALPEPIKSECLQSFLDSRAGIDKSKKPADYKEWLNLAFGERFAKEFPTAYTRKYWTTDPENLSTDWVGERVFYPEIEDVKAGYEKAPTQSKNYITSIRYPKHGGYYAYTNKLKKDANIHFKKELSFIDFENKSIRFSDSTITHYSRLINTIPLPELIAKSNAPETVKLAATELSCSDLLLLNFVVNHPAPIKNQWLYVYDADKYASRINFTNLLSPANGVEGKCGIQVEVYFSKYKKQTESLAHIIEKVSQELCEMKLVESPLSITEVNTNRIRYANVIFDHQRRKALNTVLNYLEQFGLVREADDLEPMTNWNEKMKQPVKLGDIVLAGRFGQWNYFWTDDCVMRGLFIANNF